MFIDDRSDGDTANYFASKAGLNYKLVRGMAILVLIWYMESGRSNSSRAMIHAVSTAVHYHNKLLYVPLNLLWVFVFCVVPLMLYVLTVNVSIGVLLVDSEDVMDVIMNTVAV